MTDGRTLIDGLRAEDGSLDGSAVRQLLPYGDDFLFVDRVLRLTGEEVAATFRVPRDAPYIRSHFLDLQVMPGVLLAEGLGQAASLIVRHNLSEPARQHVLGLEVERCRFPSPALPGQVVTYEARLTSQGRRAARFEGEAFVEDRSVCSARVAVAIVSRRLLAKQIGATGGA